MKVTELIKIDLSNFPTDERYAQIPGKLFMTDTLDGDGKIQHEHRDHSYPVQVSVLLMFDVIDGEIEIQMNLKRHKVTKGQHLIILPGSFIEHFDYSQDLKCIFIAESPNFADIDVKLKMAIELGEKTRTNPVNVYDPVVAEENIHTYKLLKAKLLEKDFRFKEEIAKNYLNIMRFNILNEYVKHSENEITEKQTTRKEEIFHNFIECVKKNYMNDRSVTFYADKLCVSPKYLSTLIKEVSGRFATEWITDYVILEAKALLRTDGITIKIICEKLNFPNPSFFAKYFRKNTGYSPREFKQL